MNLIPPLHYIDSAVFLPQPISTVQMGFALMKMQTVSGFFCALWK